MNPPTDVDKTLELLTEQDYVADRRLATAVFLGLKLGRPLFLEGEAGVGKTEVAKVLARGLGKPLVRLQCYEGLDTAAAVYEWNYPRQMIEIRLAEASGNVARDALAHDIFTTQFLLKRPLLQAIAPEDGVAPVLLIDELDRADEPFEAYLLEVLSDFQVTIPELGVIRAATDLGLSVPGDLSVIGFDGVALDRIIPQDLTTMVQPAADEGRAAGRAVLDLLDGGSPSSVSFSCTFHRGATTAAPG